LFSFFPLCMSASTSVLYPTSFLSKYFDIMLCQNLNENNSWFLGKNVIVVILNFNFLIHLKIRNNWNYLNWLNSIIFSLRIVMSSHQSYSEYVKSWVKEILHKNHKKQLLYFFFLDNVTHKSEFFVLKVNSIIFFKHDLFLFHK
jgi:hypothetical protein